jgi:hypothetical protein
MCIQCLIVLSSFASFKFGQDQLFFSFCIHGWLSLKCTLTSVTCFGTSPWSVRTYKLVKLFLSVSS